MVDEIERRVIKLENWRDGNGAKGAEQRIQVLESNECNMTCDTGKRLDKHIIYHREQEANQVDAGKWEKQMKLMIIGNMIGFAAVAVTLLLFVLGS